MDTFDVVVIGAGPGGYPAAIRAAQLGAKVAIVEKERLGGTCLNWGCIPTKALIASAEAFATAKGSGDLGVRVEGATPDYHAMIERKNQIVSKLQGGVKQLLGANGYDPDTAEILRIDRVTLYNKIKKYGLRR